jgi:hypothetical protein
MSSLPPVELGYSSFQPHEQRYQSVSANGGELPPRPLGTPDLRLIDLFGDGLPDVVETTAAGFRLWENLGEGRLARPHLQQGHQPAANLGMPGVTLGDVGGDGLPDLIVQYPVPGFYEGTPEGTWKTFKPFRLPFDLDNPNLRLVDLTGDGRSDALLTSDQVFYWYECLGEAGYAEPRPVAPVPGIFFNDPGGRVRLADMSGDGLSDIVLLHNGRVDYWPNLGLWTLRPASHDERLAPAGA